MFNQNAENPENELEKKSNSGLKKNSILIYGYMNLLKNIILKKKEEGLPTSKCVAIKKIKLTPNISLEIAGDVYSKKELLEALKQFSDMLKG